MTKRCSLDRGVGQTGTSGSRCGGPGRLPPLAGTALSSGAAACSGGVNVAFARTRHSQRPCPRASPHRARDHVRSLRASSRSPGQKSPSARGAGKRPGGVRPGGPFAASWLVPSGPLSRGPRTGRRVRCGAGRLGAVSPRGARSPDSSCTLPPRDAPLDSHRASEGVVIRVSRSSSSDAGGAPGPPASLRSGLGTGALPRVLVSVPAAGVGGFCFVLFCF